MAPDAKHVGNCSLKSVILRINCKPLVHHWAARSEAASSNEMCAGHAGSGVKGCPQEESAGKGVRLSILVKATMATHHTVQSH